MKNIAFYLSLIATMCGVLLIAFGSQVLNSEACTLSGIVTMCGGAVMYLILNKFETKS